MIVKPVSHNIVVIGKNFRPNIFSDYWLIKHKIVDENSFTGPKVATDEIATLSAGPFDLLVTPDRVQLILRSGHAYSELEEPLKNILGACDGYSYVAIGLTHAWILTPDGSGDIGDFTRTNFRGTSKFAEATSAGHESVASWGMIVNRPWRKWMMKTKAEPAFKNAVPSTAPEALLVDFNFNRPIQSSSEAIDSLSDLTNSYDQTVQIANSLTMV